MHSSLSSCADLPTQGAAAAAAAGDVVARSAVQAALAAGVAAA